MQAEPSIAGCTDLFASLHTVQATVQTQITRFNQLMADIRSVAGERRDAEGIDAVGEVKNDTIFGLLTLLVVLPSLAAAAAWVYGFRRPVK